jgi:hypothetical protein
MGYVSSERTLGVASTTPLPPETFRSHLAKAIDYLKTDEEEHFEGDPSDDHIVHSVRALAGWLGNDGNVIVRPSEIRLIAELAAFGVELDELISYGFAPEKDIGEAAKCLNQIFCTIFDLLGKDRLPTADTGTPTR